MSRHHVLHLAQIDRRGHNGRDSLGSSPAGLGDGGGTTDRDLGGLTVTEGSGGHVGHDGDSECEGELHFSGTVFGCCF